MEKFSTTVYIRDAANLEEERFSGRGRKITRKPKRETHGGGRLTPSFGSIFNGINVKLKIRGHPLTKAILISAGFAAVYLMITGSSTLWDRDEPRFARAS